MKNGRKQKKLARIEKYTGIEKPHGYAIFISVDYWVARSPTGKVIGSTAYHKWYSYSGAYKALKRAGFKLK